MTSRGRGRGRVVVLLIERSVNTAVAQTSLVTQTRTTGHKG